jgi:hypothetical protein
VKPPVWHVVLELRAWTRQEALNEARDEGVIVHVQQVEEAKKREPLRAAEESDSHG